MTTIPSSIVTTTQIWRGDNIQLSMSYDYTGLGTSILPSREKLQSLIDQAIGQWWSSLTNSQKFGEGARPMSLRISAFYRS